MTRKIKLIALTAIAALAVTAVAASAANAANFTAAAYPVTLSGGQDTTHNFNYQNREVTCETASFNSTAAAGAASETHEITPSYSNCHAVVLGNKLPATVEMGSCTYVFNAAGTVTVKCPSGDINIRIYNTSGGHTEGNEVCRYTVKAQGPLSGVGYTNNAGGTVTVAANVGVATERVKGTLVTCGAASATATYTGKTTVAGKSGGVATNVDVN